MKLFALSAFLVTVCLGLATANEIIELQDPREKMGRNGQVFAAYIVNWAHYRKAPYKYTADSFRPIAKRVDVALYSFIYFCPPAGTSPMPYWAKAPYGHCDDSNEYQLLSVDPTDSQYIPEIVGMGPKVVLSVGGWNFPSAYFSKMVASSESRGKFIASCKSWMSKYGVKGIDLDWEYPCSGPRSDPVKISCTVFRTVQDDGGKCPDDNDNLLLLVKDMRAAFGADGIVTIASQAGKKNAANENLKAVTQYIDMWHVMSYDYTVSDVQGGSVTSPNAPLYMPFSTPTALQMSVNDTMHYYLKQGVPANKIMVGLPLYAHTWYIPGLSGDAWKKFGLNGTIQGSCCGPFAQTYGAKYGQGCQLCGSYMYSEIVAAGCPTYFDTETASDISYCTSAGKDSGYTAAGTWMSYNSIKSAQAFVAYEISMGFGGIFIYSTDMDTIENGQFTYKYMNAIADAIAATPTPPPTPAAPTPPTPPTPAPPTPPPTPAPPACGSWTEVCKTCTGGTSNCIACKTDPSKWQCRA